MAAGQYIAMASPAVRALYAHVHDINPAWVVTVQFGRGLLWCALTGVMVRNLNGPAWRSALLAGIAFIAFTDPQLLIPNPIMSWPVRLAHTIEIGVSHAVFFPITALLLLMGAKRKRSDAGMGAAVAPA